MQAEDELRQRVTELEIKLSFAEDALDTLNEVVVRQQGQIDQLVRVLAELRQRLESDTKEPGGAALDRPPHY